MILESLAKIWHVNLTENIIMKKVVKWPKVDEKNTQKSYNWLRSISKIHSALWGDKQGKPNTSAQQKKSFFLLVTWLKQNWMPISNQQQQMFESTKMRRINPKWPPSTRLELVYLLQDFSLKVILLISVILVSTAPSLSEGDDHYIKLFNIFSIKVLFNINVL